MTKVYRIIGLKILAVIALVLLNFNFNGFYPDAFVAFIIIKFVVLGVLFFTIFQVLQYCLKHEAHYILISGESIFFLLLLLEVVFTFIPRSHHAEESYASMIWQKYYFKYNADGFRDELPKQKNDSAIVFLGDSYTAGYGIKREEDRFSNLVAKQLEEQYECYNLGLKGTGLKTHQSVIDQLSVKGSVMVYQILINDLDDYCMRSMPLYNIYSTFSKWDYLVARSSFLLNYLYFNFPNNTIEKQYFSFFQSCYEDQEVFDAYSTDLVDFINHALTSGKFEKVVVLILPTLSDLSLSQPFDMRVASLLSKETSAQVIYPAEDLQTMDLEKRIVNMHDTHPSIAVNELIAKVLLKSGVFNEEN